ncbi:MAG: glucose-1-phosphate thymidylyltransferase [Bacteroidetes bacterium]|nr:GlmU family protein [Bacteroidia bacterium]PCH69595.1 MAG: glucose-1-phosphate thymidylyltransferase [Bacteroidota bacterium]
MNFILFDDSSRTKFLPFTYTRPIADIRTGILTIREKWEKHLNVKTSTITAEYLSTKFPLVKEEKNVLIKGNLCPNKDLVNEICSLKVSEGLFDGDIFLAACLSDGDLEGIDIEDVSSKTKSCINFDKPYFQLNHIWDIFRYNGERINMDFRHLTNGRESEPISGTNTILGDESKIFIEKGAKIECSILNIENGQIYIGKDAEVMEGSKIRGPFALCENSVLKMDTKIYGPTTVGPHSKVGGEVNNSVIFGYSNKAHDGFLGNSVIGEWCNLGADTNNSNLKNNYANVKLWDYSENGFVDSELQFCGLFMGDHSKCGINTMFNTGTVAGVSANIFGGGFPRNFIPSYSWGGAAGFTTFKVEKAFEVARMVMERRGLELDDQEKKILEHVYNETAQYRNWEK